MKTSVRSAEARAARRAVLGAVTTTIACVIPVFLVGGLAVQVSAELHFSPAGLGLVVSAYFGISALASVPSGSLVERYGPTGTARAGIVLSALTLAAVGFAARSLAVLVALLAVAGVGNALGQLASNATLAAHVPAARQGLSFGLKQAAIPASTLLAGLAVPVVALTLGWRWAFGLGAGLAMAALPLVPRDARGRRRRAAPERGEQATTALVVIGAGAMLAAGAANALGSFLVDAAVAGGLAPASAGLALTAGGAVCLVSRVFGGWLADRRSYGHMPVIAGSLVVGAAGLALLAVPRGATLMIGVLLGFGLGWSWPGLMNFAVVQLHPQAPAAATSITQTGVYAGGCAGPLAFGATAAASGYPTAWLGAASAMFVAAGLMLVGNRLLVARLPWPNPGPAGTMSR
jgi:MFS family permease